MALKFLVPKTRWFGALALICSAPAFAWPFYFAPATYFSIPDSDRGAGKDYGLQITTGYSLSDYFSFEALSESSRYRLDNSSINIKTYGASLQGVYTALPRLELSPVVIGGGGWLHTDTSKSNYDSAVARGGLGLRWQIPDSNFGFRTDAVVRHEFDSRAYNDYIFSVGLTYRMGNPTYHDPTMRTGAVPVAADAVLEPFVGTGQGSVQANVAVSKPALVESTFHGTVSKGAVSANDSDGDGVDDQHDKCPDTPPNAVVDSDGCIIYIRK